MPGQTTIIRTTCVYCLANSYIEVETEKYERWRGGEFVQHVWPEMSAGDRELLISGTHSDCFDEMFPDPDD